MSPIKYGFKCDQIACTLNAGNAKRTTFPRAGCRFGEQILR
jgi:hypothetical protein